MGGFKSKFRDDAEFVYRLGKTLYAAFSNLGTIVKTVLTELRDAVENALFFNGPKYAGYAHGKIVFDAILTTVTGGTSLAQTIAVKGLSVFCSLGDDLISILKKGVFLTTKLIRGNRLFSIDKILKVEDIVKGIVIDNNYLLNPTARNVKSLIINPSGTMKLSQSPTTLLNGMYMYVVDVKDNIIIGTRAPGIAPFYGKAPHPTLIGGKDPLVKGAGIVEFRGGKIYKIDNYSGHYKPDTESLKYVQFIFGTFFKMENFSSDFAGYINYVN